MGSGGLKSVHSWRVSLYPIRKGQIESPSWWRLEFRANPANHVTLLSVQPLNSADYFSTLKDAIASSANQAGLLFVHGYNVTFEDAALRMAQIAHDLEFEGVPIFYSWPSKGEAVAYARDETNSDWSRPHLRQVLTHLLANSGVKDLYLIAHSMGSRSLGIARNPGCSRWPHEASRAVEELLQD